MIEEKKILGKNRVKFQGKQTLWENKTEWKN